MTLEKIKPEHMATLHAIESMKDTIKNLHRNIADLQATLPRVHKSRLNKKDKYIVNPYTKKKEYYS